MHDKHLTQALEDVCGFIALESDIKEILDAVHKDQDERQQGWKGKAPDCCEGNCAIHNGAGLLSCGACGWDEFFEMKKEHNEKI